MQFGCHTWGFNDRPLSDALGTIARLGFRYVDIGSGPHWDVVAASEKPQKTADTIRRDLDAFSLGVSDLYLMLPRISTANDARREHEFTSFKALLPFAKALGTAGITVSPGMRESDNEDDIMARVIDVLRRMVESAGEHGIPVSIEPHLDSVAPTPAKARQLIDEVSGLKVTLDWAHLITQEMKPDEAVSLLPHTRHIQIRQAAPRRVQTPFDQGVVDLQRVITLLLSAGYGGVVTVETMQIVGWHGAAPVDPINEAWEMRNALRDLRDQYAN